MIESKGIYSFDGSYIAYDIVGNGPKKVFLIHGIMNDRNTWLPHAIALSLFSNKYTFYIVELRGHGRSTNNKFDSDTPFLDIAKDIEWVARTELKDDEKAVLACYSMGCAPSVFLQKYGMGKWIKKYIIIEHALEVVYKDPRKSFFYLMIDEFSQKGLQIEGYIQRNTEYSMFLNLNDLEETYRKSAIRAHEIIIQSSLHEGRLSWLKKLKGLLNWYMMTFVTNYHKKWMQYNSIAVRYLTQDMNLGPCLKESGIPAEFFVGMKSGVFESSWNIETIEKWMPGSKIYKFENSGHALLTTEPINVYNALKEALE